MGPVPSLQLEHVFACTILHWESTFRVSLRQFELSIFRPIVSWYLILFFASLFAREVYSEIVENCR